MKKTKLNILLLVLVTVLVLYFTLKDDFNGVLSLTFHINIWWLLLALVFVFLSWFCLSLTLYVVANNHERKLTIKEALKSTLITNFFNAVTPFSTGGQPFQALNLRNQGYNLSTATNIIVQHSTLYQIVLVIFGLLAFIMNYIYGFFPADNLLRKFVALGFIINVLVIVILFFISFGKKAQHSIIKFIITLCHKIKIIKNKDEKIEKFREYVDNFSQSNNHFLKNKKVFWQGLLFDFLSFAFMYIVPLILAFGLNIYNGLNIMSVFTASAYIALIGSFVPIPGGSGGVEFGFAHFFGFFVQGPTLMTLLLIWRIATYYLGMLIGGIMFMVSDERRD